MPVNLIGDNAVSVLQHDDRYGTLAGSFIGEVLESKQGAWTKLEGAYATIEVTSFAFGPTGFFYTDKRSVLVEHVTGQGYCEIHAPDQTFEGTSEVARSQDELIVIGGAAATPLLFWWSAIDR